MADNVLRFKSVMDDKVSASLDRIRGKFDTLGKSGGFKAFAQGIGQGAGQAAFNLTTQAVGNLTDVLGDSIQAAIEDEHSQQRLAIALKDNIKNYDGSTRVIEETIKAREALAFADEEQRQGLSTLVGVTKDINQALALEAGAMDIARARGVDLATASDAVAKAFAGNTKQLKSLIPGLDLGTSSAEALANAFAMVKGQADAYADTSAGKVEKAQIRVNEAMERAGYTILPAVAEALDVVSFALDRTSIPAERLIQVAKGTSQHARDARIQLEKMGIYVNLLGKQADDTYVSLKTMNREIARTPVGLGTGAGGGKGGHRASGGPVAAGGRYTVGEEGSERLVMFPGGGGYVIPNGGGSRSGGGGVIHTHVYLNGREIAMAVDRENYSRLQRAAPTMSRV